ncbi:uncharacterized protein LOC135347799 isoform X6 [Halichondria panicea]|uniref:uncharacterized protein LOC135347799 isoform X6 n=1 Tax=Halichondria panicea TaxID=6063 RepID=UPI00312BC27C
MDEHEGVLRLNVEYRVFQQMYSTLHTGIQAGLSDVVNEVFAKGLISPHTKSVADNVGIGEPSRASILLNSMLQRTKTCPKTFIFFAEALDSITSFQYLSMDMRSNFTALEEQDAEREREFQKKAKLQEMKRQELQLQIVQKPKRLSVEPVHVAEPDSHTSPGLSVSNMHRIDRPRPPSPMVYVGLVNKAATQLSEDTPLTQDEIDALQKLIEGTGVNIDDIIATGQGITLEEAQQMLAEKGYAEDAGNLKTRLQEIAKEQQRYLEILKDLMTAAGTIDLRYLKLFLVGPPYVGKTTTLSRLLKTFENIHSAGDKSNIQSTLLANCIQAFAFVGDDTAEWLSSNNVDNEAQLLFNYLCGPLDTPLSEQLSEEHTTPPKPSREQSHVQQDESHKLISVENVVSQVDKLDTSDGETKTCKNQRINDGISRFQKLIKSGDYSTLFKALGTFLNINDIGGQPGFLEMLPALSTGPAMYLVFLDLSKELNEPYKIHFSRKGKKITPYDAIHTVKETVSQILSSISSIHSNPQVTCSFKTDKVDGFSEKLKLFQQVSPLAALIGTHKDKLEHPEKEIKKKSKDLNDIVKEQFDKIMISPDATDSNLFTVDNYHGTEQSDIGPLRKVLSEIFQTRFKNASLPIRPKWLLFGLILRREYKIASIEDCLELGKKLEMDENETTFCLRYLHDCVGTIMHYTSVLNDKKNWLKNHVICSLQVLFDSISELILPSLCVLRFGGAFTEDEKKLFRKGQYSAKTIEMYCKKSGNNELIPTKNLISLLQHLNLLSEIIHKDVNDPSKCRITYFMSAILECASQDELTNPPPPDANNPEPLLITFSCGYVPTGVFCVLITRLVSQGPHGILGFTWEFVEDGVKRNCVSFLVAKTNKVTLLAHDQCYEIRVVCNPGGRMSLHDLCTYVLSVMLYTLKSLYPHLVPQIAFQCPCPDHKSSRDNLCALTEDFWVQFLCGSNPVTPTKDQQVWLGKTVSIGQSASLEVFRFIKGQSLKTFSFNWSKVGDDDTQLSTHHRKLTFQSVSEEDLDYYQCEVKEAGKVVLTVYRALYKDTLMSESLLGECSGAADQKRRLSAGETSSAKRPQSISPQGVIRRILRSSWSEDSWGDIQCKTHTVNIFSRRMLRSSWSEDNATSANSQADDYWYP